MLSICAVYDKKTGLYDQLFTVRHHAEAEREWGVVKQDPKTKFGKNPEDFSLLQIGNYDDTTGEVIPVKPHKQLG